MAVARAEYYSERAVEHFLMIPSPCRILQHLHFTRRHRSHYAMRGEPPIGRHISGDLESPAPLRDNGQMANDNNDFTDVLADLKEVARQAMSGGIRDLEMLGRVQQRARQAREEVIKKFGVQEIGVDIIREMRDAP